MQNTKRLAVGDVIQIDARCFPDGKPVAGKEYERAFDSESLYLFAGDPSEEKPCVFRVNKVEDGMCTCEVTYTN